MAEIRTFCAVHPAEGLASKLAALPYDVYSRDEAREQVKKAPESFLAIDRPETQFPKDQDMYAPEVYQKARSVCQIHASRCYDHQKRLLCAGSAEMLLSV